MPADNRSPLQKWRESFACDRREIAALVPVSVADEHLHHVIAHAEMGAVAPADDRLIPLWEKIAVIGYPDLRVQQDAWFEARRPAGNTKGDPVLSTRAG